MKGKLIVLVTLAGLWLNVGCKRDNVEPAGLQQGTFSLDLAANTVVEPMTDPVPEGLIQAPAAADFKVEVVRDDEVVKQWERFSEMPAQIRLDEGDYLLRASYGEPHTGGKFGNPRFTGEAAFSVVRKESGGVSLTCKLASVIVTAEYTDGFKNYFKDYGLTFTAENTPLVFAKDETRPAFFNPGNIAPLLSLTKPDGTSTTFSPTTLTGAKAGEYYRFLFDVGENGAGGKQLLISFSEQTAEVPVKIDLSAEWLPDEAPKFAAEGFVPGGELPEVFEGARYETPVSALAIARATIASCVITTDSEALIDQGWPASVDLVGISEADKAKLRELGLKWTESLAGLNMAQIDFTGVSEHLLAADTDPIEHRLNVVLTDAAGQSGEPLVVGFKALPPEFLFEPYVDGAPRGSKPTVKTNSAVAFYVKVAAGDPRKLQFEYYDEIWDEWKPAASTYGSPIIADPTIHLIRITANWAWNPIRLRARYGERMPYQEISQELKNPSLGGSVQDIWTNRGTVRVTGVNLADKYYDAGDYSLQISDNDGATYTPHPVTMRVDGSSLYADFSGLAPNKAYKVKVLFDTGQGIGTAEKVYSLTTKSELQLDQRGIDDWATTAYNNIPRGGKTINAIGIKSDAPKKTVTSYEATGWATVNAKTIPASAANPNTWYMVPSTLRTGGRSGQAALIRSVGWNNNGPGVEDNDWKAANGTGTPVPPNGSTAFNYSAGRLFLSGGYSYDHGSGAETFNEGVSFDSRPAKVKFYYKYNSVGGEQGMVHVVVRKGNAVMAENKLSLPAAGDWTPFEVPLTYNAVMATSGTTLQIMFASVDEGLGTPATNEVLNNDYYSRIGSELYIDDVEMIYE